MNTATNEDETTMRDDFEAAFSEVDEVDESAPSEAPSGEIQAQETHTETSTEETESQSVGSDEVAPVIEQSNSQEATAPDSSDNKPPASWKPTEREGWEGVPASARQAIIRREKEMENTMRETAQARQIASSLHQTLTPYRAIFDAEGVSDPMQAVGSLLQSAASLRMGSPQQKAAEVASIISRYGVDIQTLDNALAGDTDSNPMNQVEQMIDQRMQPFMSQMQQEQNYRQHQVQSNAQNTINEFKKNAEFLDDVSHDMADLMDMASARGQQMGIDEAYKKAIAMNPEISSVIRQREQQQRIATAAQNNQQKLNAASSIRGTQSGTGNGKENLSLHDQLSQAWDSHNRV